MHKNKSFELEFINFPLFDKELSLRMPCVLNWCVLTSDILSIAVITDWEFTIWFLFIWVIHYADITTSKCWSSLRITCNCKLGKVKFELFVHIKWKNETCQRFISNPMLFIWGPCNRSVTSNLFVELVMNQSQSIRNIVAELMELFNRKVLFTSSIK